MFDAMAEPALTIRDTSYRYGSRQALAGVNLTVNAGEIYTLLGPNGAGKTTLVRAISSRILPSEGTIHIAGKEVGVRRPANQSLGIVPQQIALYPYLTARENLITFARLMKVDRRASRVRADAFLARSALGDRASSLVSTLSGGMQRRVNIGAALMHCPKLLVLDEPTVGVDLHAREAIHELLLQLRGEGYAILLTTHDMDQAAQLSDRVGIIHAGSIAAEGAPDGLIQGVFGDGKELVVTVARSPDETQRALLIHLGLQPVRRDIVWSGVAPDAFDAGAPHLQMLTDSGLEMESVNVRQPSLGSVFFHVVGQELGG